MKVRIRNAVDADGNHIEVSYWLWCPGCDDAHRITDAWGFNGDIEKPTFTPSILVNSGGGNPKHPICHSYLTDGVWNFLGDCTHVLANHSVPMVDLPDWLANE